MLKDGLVFPEGPRWHEGRLWFSDMHAHRVLAMSPDGATEEIATVPQRPSGLGWDTEGRLLVVSMGDRRLLRMDSAGVFTIVAELMDFTGGDINDMVVDGRGRAYIGNFGVGYGGGGAPQTTNLVIVSPDGATRSVADDLFFPNGVVITPDGRTLIVAETFGRRLTAFDIAGDGSLSGRRVWAELGAATPDGICLDAEGAVWVASPTTEEFVRVREGGQQTDRIPTPGKWAVACMLGGEDHCTLYLLTAETSGPELAQGKAKGFIETATVPVPGAGWP
jgi:sugar lactone lactonase YvrE